MMRGLEERFARTKSKKIMAWKVLRRRGLRSLHHKLHWGAGRIEAWGKLWHTRVPNGRDVNAGIHVFLCERQANCIRKYVNKYGNGEQAVVVPVWCEESDLMAAGVGPVYAVLRPREVTGNGQAVFRAVTLTKNAVAKATRKRKRA